MVRNLTRIPARSIKSRIQGRQGRDRLSTPGRSLDGTLPVSRQQPVTRPLRASSQFFAGTSRSLARIQSVSREQQATLSIPRDQSPRWQRPDCASFLTAIYLPIFHERDRSRSTCAAMSPQSIRQGIPSGRKPRVYYRQKGWRGDMLCKGIVPSRACHVIGMARQNHDA